MRCKRCGGSGKLDAGIFSAGHVCTACGGEGSFPLLEQLIRKLRGAKPPRRRRPYLGGASTHTAATTRIIRLGHAASTQHRCLRCNGSGQVAGWFSRSRCRACDGISRRTSSAVPGFVLMGSMDVVGAQFVDQAQLPCIVCQATGSVGHSLWSKVCEGCKGQRYVRPSAPPTKFLCLREVVRGG